MDDGSGDDSQTPDSLATSRSRRTKKDKFGRLSALQRLKELKGTKNKYEVKGVENVYEEVDEREYSKRRQDRMEEDWIIDDDGSGYVEDGREIFDEEDTDEMFFSKKDKKKKSDKTSSSQGSSRGNAGNIKNMLINMPSKKKVEKVVKLDEDEILGDILQDLEKDEPEAIKPAPLLMKKKKKVIPEVRVGPINPFNKKLKEAQSPINIKSSPKMLVNKTNKEAPVSSPKARRTLAPAKEIPTQNIKEEESMEVDDSAAADMDDLAQAFDSDEEEDLKLFSDIKIPEKTEIQIKSEQPAKKEIDPSNKENQGFISNSIKDETKLNVGWDTVKGDINEPAIQEVIVDSSKLPFVTNNDGEQVLRFYWIDAYEDYYNKRGVVYLFGKVWIDSAKAHVSCCVAVKNIPRKIYLLKREKHKKTGEEVSMMDVYNEFNSNILERFKIPQFRSRVVAKMYAFENHEVPNEAEYLEVQYSADCTQLPSDLNGDTFSHVFGTTTASMETFLLDRRIKGPCWLDVKLPQLPKAPVSWCKVEAFVLQPNNICVYSGPASAPPPLVVVTLQVQTMVNPKTHHNEIVMVAALVHQEFHLDRAAPQPPFQYHFCCVCRPNDMMWPWDLKDALPKFKSTKVEKIDSERGLLGFLTAKIHKIDPDILVGHDIFGFDLTVLLHRISSNKIPHWSKLGRLKRTNMPKLVGSKGFVEKLAVCGRLVCDIKISAKELIRAKSYDLGALVAQILRVPENERLEVNSDVVKKMYDNSSSLLQLVTSTMQDASYILRLMCDLNILPLALQITNIAGNVMSRTLLGGRSERNEFLLLHAFNEKGYIVPDKTFGKNKNLEINVDEDGEENRGKGKKKASYAGGLVLDPKKGFYDKYILLMDFNSLYPSIIQEYNICFTTMKRLPPSKNKDEDILPELPDSSLETGVLPTEIRKLVESRRQVKNLMKQPDISSDLKLQYDIRQKALKITANSMYGCLGFSYSRFYARHLAALVTGRGREILLQTRDLVQKMNFEVIYGDTDSIMINTNCTDYDQVFKLGHKIKSEVNKLYKQLELDVDGVFKYMLLLKKKKYAALTMTKLPNGQVIAEQELKGLDIVRRDWSQIASDAGKHIVNQILSDQGPDERIENIHSHLESLKDKLEKGTVSLDDLAITKQLTKNPEEYPDKKSLPHVQVALRMNSRGGKKLRQGDTVAYVICEDGSNLGANQRAYHVDELKTNSSLKVDKNYYLASQIHPVVSRLCDPIDGTDSARIAECLGLDPSGYRQSIKYGHKDEDDELGSEQISEEELYRLCERFTFNCPKPECDTLITMDSPFSGMGSSLEVVLEKCVNPKCKFPFYSNVTPLLNKLRMDIRKHIAKYYEGWLICEDPGCNNRTRRIPLRFSRGFPVCSLCHRGVLYKEFSEYQLYKQLCFYETIFDFPKACQKNKDERIRDETLKKVYNILCNEVKLTLQYNAYSEINLSKIFSSLYNSY